MTSHVPIRVQPVVMAGGSGTRLWPLSRAAYPKQLLVFTADGKTLYQQAVGRLQALAGVGCAVAAPITVGNEEHRFMVLDQLREIGVTEGHVVLEPSARNTAPAMTLAALDAREAGADPVLVVTPADHVVPDGAAFIQSMHIAIRAPPMAPSWCSASRRTGRRPATATSSAPAANRPRAWCRSSSRSRTG